MKKRILACLLTLCLMLGLASALGLSVSAEANTYTMTALYNNGEFTVALKPGDKVTISTAEELNLLAAYTNAGNTTAYAIFELTADIVLNNGIFGADGSWSGSDQPVAFTPIGAGSFTGHAFRGRFNGNGHTISGLYVNSANTDAVGLFGHLAGTASIHDLTITNSYVAGNCYVGGIVGLSLSNAATPTLDNCRYEGFVQGFKAVGGILGGSFGSTVVNCVNYGTVSGVASANGLGGILGAGYGYVQVINCLNAGNVGNNAYASAIGGIVGKLTDNATGTVSNCASYGTAIGSNDAGVSVSACFESDLAQAETVIALNALLSASAENASSFHAWTAVNGELELTAATALVSVTTADAGATYLCATLTEAAAIANANEGCTITLLRDGTTDAAELNGTCTIDLNGKHLTAYAPLTVTGGALLITDNSDAVGGITSVGCSTLILSGNGTPTLKVNDGYLVATPDPAIHDDVTSFAIVNYTKGNLFLSGAPYIKGGNGIAVYVGHEGTLHGADGDKSYEGVTLGVSCGWILDDDQVLAKDAKDGQFSFLNYNTSSYNVLLDGDVYTVESIAFFPWILFIVIVVVAFGVVMFTLVHTVRYTRRMKFLSFSFPVLALITGTQLISMLVAAGVCVAAVVTCIMLTRSQNKKYAAAKAAKEQADAEEAAAKEAAKAAEEAEKAAAEAAAAEAAEQAVEEVAEEPAVEAPAEEATAETVDQTVEEAVEEPAEEVVEEAVAEPAEEAAEEATAEVAEEITEETAEEETLEESAEELDEDEDEEDDAVESGDESEETADEAAAPASPAVPPKMRPDRLVVAETDANGNVIYSAYKKSFTARIIQSPADVQERYGTLKNALLSYKKVNSRVSWSYDSIKSGRKQLAKFAIRGKSLCLFLALDPNTLEDSKYNIADAGKSKKYETVPCRLRLSSKRSIKWGLELISILAEREGLELNPKFKAKEWRMENETTESLIEKGLIKKVV